MVKEIRTKKEKYYQCGECKLIYRDKNIAEECDRFCKQFKSCNLEIIKHAVENKNIKR